MNKTPRTLVLVSAACFLAVCFLPSRSPSREVPSRSFDFHYLVHVGAPPAGGQEMRLWIPLPYEDSYQSISDLHIQSPVRYEIRRENEYRDRYAYFDISSSELKTSFDVDLTFRAKRLEHSVSLQPVADRPSDSVSLEPAHFLQPDRLVPIDGQISDLSRQQTAGATDSLDKARKLYDYVIATMHYDHDGAGWGRGDAVWACNAKHGNCTDFHSLFIGMARAAGIPARFEIGFPLPAAADQGTISGYHCWAEFYVDRIGWIPIDASEAWKNPDKRDYFFGATDANRVMFTLGRDIRLNPAPSGDPLNYFVYPYAELDGKPYTNLKNEFSFRDEPVAGRANTSASPR